MFRLSSLGNEPPPFKREKKMRKRRGEKREKRKNDRDSDYVADAPQEFVVCVFRYEPYALALARVPWGRRYSNLRAIVRRIRRWYSASRASLLTSCSSQLQCRISHLRRFRHLLRRRWSATESIEYFYVNYGPTKRGNQCLDRLVGKLKGKKHRVYQ